MTNLRGVIVATRSGEGTVIEDTGQTVTVILHDWSGSLVDVYRGTPEWAQFTAANPALPDEHPDSNRFDEVK